MIKPYDFVPFLKYQSYEQRGNMEGKIPIEIETLTPIHISSGSYAIVDNKTIYKEFIKVNNKVIIPGTSFKGCVRNIAESISYSCLSIDYKNRNIDKSKLPDKREIKGKKCIICDMFGSMGYKSKIQFSDLKAKNYKTTIKGIPRSFNPNPRSRFYFDNNGRYKGYKFYKHGINGIQPTGKILCEFVLPGAQFEGNIIFRNLTSEQLQLLCFSLGLSGDINPKIGYGKQYFYGSIIVKSDPKWEEIANQYKVTGYSDIKNNIDCLTNILNFKNAVRSIDEG